MLSLSSRCASFRGQSRVQHQDSADLEPWSPHRLQPSGQRWGSFIVTAVPRPPPPPREKGNYDAASTMVDLKSSRPQTSFPSRAEVSLPHASTCRRGRREEGPSPKARPPSLALWRLSGQNPSACTRPHWGPGWLLVAGSEGHSFLSHTLPLFPSGSAWTLKV